MSKLNSFLFFLLYPFFLSQAENVKFLFVEEKKRERVFLFPGRVSLLKLPCSITKAVTGSPKDIKTEVDKLNKKEVHILLKKWSSKPTNLILKCKEKVFLFSLIPSKNTHYDYVNVLGHITSKPLKVKSTLQKSPLLPYGGLKEEDFKIRKILDFSWEDSK